MLIKNGGCTLRDFAGKRLPEDFRQITAGVWYAQGMGHSNAVAVEGNTGVLLIDTLDTLERGEQLQKRITAQIGKPVKTIVYTHGHPDHRGGAGAFAAQRPEIIAFAPKTPTLARTEQLQDVQAARGARQFGYALSDAEAVTQGIGRREGIVYGERRGFVPPTTVYEQDKAVREIDGISVELVRLPGEAEDEAMVWLPQAGVLCCGDNYYGCFPNLYAIRGGQYRDLAVWVNSIDTLLSYPARYLLPGHTAAICGRENIRETLQNFRDAIDLILTQTLAGMNAGKSADALAAEIRLPEKYAALPYLAEHYGCVEWTVRAVYAAYLGWFDGNPTHLHPLAPAVHAEKTVALMGGAPAVLAAARTAMGEQEYQWCLELCDLLPAAGGGSQALQIKAQALKEIAERETSANGRHYYLVCANEILAQLEG